MKQLPHEARRRRKNSNTTEADSNYTSRELSERQNRNIAIAGQQRVRCAAGRRRGNENGGVNMRTYGSARGSADMTEECE